MNEVHKVIGVSAQALTYRTLTFTTDQILQRQVLILKQPFKDLFKVI